MPTNGGSRTCGGKTKDIAWSERSRGEAEEREGRSRGESGEKQRRERGDCVVHVRHVKVSVAAVEGTGRNIYALTAGV